MSTSTANDPPFRSMQQMVKQGGRSGLVRLSFVDTPEQDALYAHEAYLMAASGVLRDLLACDEDGSASEAAGPLTKVARTSSNGDVQTAGVHAVLPLHDISVAAWEDALSLLYPSTMMTAEVSWDNAERLLILADKYDMGCITEHVKRFMLEQVNKQTRLAATLATAAVDAFEWLPVFSRCGLDDQATACIEHIVSRSLQLPAGFFSSGIQQRHLEQLYNTMQRHNKQHVTQLETQLKHVQDQLQQASNSLASALLPQRGLKCERCNAPWYQQYGAGSVAAPTCVSCGATKAASCVLVGYREEQSDTDDDGQSDTDDSSEDDSEEDDDEDFEDDGGEGDEHEEGVEPWVVGPEGAIELVDEEDDDVQEYLSDEEEDDDEDEDDYQEEDGEDEDDEGLFDE